MDTTSEKNPFSKLKLDSGEAKLTPEFHTWLPDGSVLASSDAGQEIIKYNTANGKAIAWIGANARPSTANALADDDVIEEVDEDGSRILVSNTMLQILQAPNMTCIIVGKNSVFTAGKVKNHNKQTLK